MKKYILNKINSKPLKKIVLEFFKKYGSRFYESPAAKKIHHAHIGGLKKHTKNMIESAIKIYDVYKKQYDINLDVIIVSILFHDCGKIYECELKKNDKGKSIITKTNLGEIYGHIHIGAKMFNEIADGINDLHPNIKSHIEHIILSHHGKLSYGSCVIPKTTEAIIVHMIDFLDSRIDIYGSETKKLSFLQNNTEIVKGEKKDFIETCILKF